LEAAVPATASPQLWDHNLLRRWRDEAGLRPEPVAAQLGRSVAWLYALEGGTYANQPGVDSLISLCRVYGHELAELIIPADETEPARAAS
jgi:transcriptional regulator with XRE-family HTH domain